MFPFLPFIIITPVAGNHLDYLWLLSRDITMPSYIMHRYIEIAERIGYDTGKLVWTRQ